MERLDAAELVPFRAAVAAGVPLVMTAHILLPQVDAERPASLSPILLDSVLRQRMGFGGVILADDLGMGAIARRYGPGEAAVSALTGGTDIVMLCHDWPAVAPAIAFVREVHEQGRFAEHPSRSSLERIERVCGLTESDVPQPPLEIIGCTEHRALAAEIRAIAR
jgi:beta-glucosidase-like glycosyl hydrolase